MILPRVLIIDDQYAGNEFLRNGLLENAGIVEIKADITDKELSEISSSDTVAAAVFCSGQKVTKTTIENRYDIIKESVAKGWSNGSKFKWNLILLDVRFDSKPIKAEDDRFGEVVRNHLIHDFQGLPLVMFSSKGESDIERSNISYFPKDGLAKQQLKECLLDHGLLNIEQYRHILEIENDVVVKSPAMIEVYRKAFRYSATDESVLILGDSGVGKEKVAHYIHRMSPRHNGPFVPVNMAAIPETLIESELFGVIRNYPGFHNREEQIGKFELANNGTLFLDEIGDMPLTSQVKILRALQEKQIYRLGGNEPIELNVRVLAATARNLQQKIKDGQFLNDLFHRIEILPITIPPLQKHAEDIVPLAESFLAKCLEKQNKNGISLSNEARKHLEKYPFAKNNVRELENLIKRLVTTENNTSVIDERDITAALNQGDSVTETPPTTSSTQAPSDEARESKVTKESALSLRELPELLRNIQVPVKKEELDGILSKLNGEYQSLLIRILRNALEDTMDRKPGKSEGVIQPTPAIKWLLGKEAIEAIEARKPTKTVINEETNEQEEKRQKFSSGDAADVIKRIFKKLDEASTDIEVQDALVSEAIKWAKKARPTKKS